MRLDILNTMDDVDECVGSTSDCEATIKALVRCTSSLHEGVGKAVQIIRENPLLVSRAEEHFHLLDPLIEYIEAKVFLASDVDQLLFGLGYGRDDMELLNNAYCAWETALEQNFVERLCAGISSLSDYRLNNRFQRLLKRETSMLRHRNHRRALFIGSGPFPISAVWLHRYLGVTVDGLDLSSDAVERSRALIAKLGLEGSINIIHEDSPHYDVGAYDVIIIALLAKPKKVILDNIYASAKPDCEVICRTSSGPRSVLYEPTPISAEILSKYAVRDARVISGAADDTISSLLLTRI
ncbi:nicotianamine synthase family protein [Luteibacter sp. 9135]|uniref:nicotianamine synthase family protein n=1 Tax=Luteibacter sp. 9135 TaxID=1500893 RepID=UPI00056D4AA9|nr:nicotianamine synthase family protein [Luteibacter sp. 9135]